MTDGRSTNQLNRFTEIHALSDKVSSIIKRFIAPMAIALVAETAYVSYSGKPGAVAFAVMSVGTCVAMLIWSRFAIGLPLLPMMAIQSLIIYGVPIAAGHDSILDYPAEFLLEAGIEVFIFNVVMAGAWRIGMQLFSPSPPICYSLREFNRSGERGWSKLGFGLILGSTAFQVLQGLDFAGPIFAELPSGSSSILYALTAVASACGFFLIALVVGGTQVSFLGKAVFWSLLVVNAMISASGFLLTSAAANLITVSVGFFWSNGRIPWRYLTIAMLSLSFLNVGKGTMRSRYWESADSEAKEVSLAQTPAVFAEWFQASLDAIVQNNSSASTKYRAGSPTSKNQTLLDRVDNLQNMLFVIDAEKVGHIAPLGGDTYTLIPPLLVPRILWPDKPRTHEGQILLNTHFGRQDLDSTFTTYIAWGLLPEAYGNFGPVAGSIFLGAVLGLFFAWVENLSSRKLVVSLEGFLSLNLLMSLMNSFEMVASVLVTSTFQSMVIILAAGLPFVRRTVTKRS